MFGRARSEEGAAAVEFALALPLLAVLFCGVVDYGQAVNLQTQLNDAARAGAQYATVYPTDTAGITWAASNAVRTPSSDMTASVLTPLVDPTTGSTSSSGPVYCTCADSNPALTNQVDCVSGKNSSGNAGCTGWKFFVAVTTTQTYSTLLPYPGLPSTIAMTGSATLRVQ